MQKAVFARKQEKLGDCAKGKGHRNSYFTLGQLMKKKCFLVSLTFFFFLLDLLSYFRIWNTAGTQDYVCVII